MDTATVGGTFNDVADIWVTDRDGVPQDIYRVYIGTLLIWTETEVIAEPTYAVGVYDTGVYEG